MSLVHASEITRSSDANKEISDDAKSDPTIRITKLGCEARILSAKLRTSHPSFAS